MDLAVVIVTQVVNWPLAVLTARVMPVVPFVAVSYAAGLLGVRLAAYTVGTAIGVLPGSVAYVAIGSSAAVWRAWTPSVGWPTVAVVVLVLVGGLALGTRLRGRVRLLRDGSHGSADG